MTTLNKVKTTKPIIANDQTKSTTLMQKFIDVPLMYKVAILVLQAIINIVLLVCILLYDNGITTDLMVKDTMFPIQLIKNIELISIVFKQYKTDSLFSNSTYPKFYVGISLYMHHINKLNKELQKYKAGQQYDFTFNTTDNNNQIKLLSQRVAHYDQTADKMKASEDTFQELIQKRKTHEVALTSIYNVQGYIPRGIIQWETIREFESDTSKLYEPRCRLVVVQPTEKERKIYKEIEQYFNMLLKDSYVSFAIKAMQQTVEQAT